MEYRNQKRIRAVKNLVSGSSDASGVTETAEEAAEKDKAMPIIS